MKQIINYGCILIMVLILNQSVTAQNHSKPKIKNLVFGGGGTWGIAYGGAILELEKQGALKDLQRVAGTSVGAIEALILAVGYTPQEVSDIINKLQVDQFNDNGFPLIGGMVRMSNGYGWFRGNRFLRWLDKTIRAKTGNGDLTFAQLHELAKNKSYLDLYITGTNLSKQKMVVFGYENFPDMKINDAVRISMSVPFYFVAPMMDGKGRLVSRSTEDNPADVMVDGGVVNNFPIDIFDKKRFLYPGNVSDDYEFNHETLGLRVQSDSQIVYDQNLRGLAPFTIHSLKDFTIAFYTFTLEKLNKESREPENIKRTIPISTLNTGQRVRRISAKQKQALMDSGRKAVMEYYK